MPGYNFALRQNASKNNADHTAGLKALCSAPLFEAFVYCTKKMFK